MEYVIEQGTISTGIIYVENNCILYKPVFGETIIISIPDIVIIGEYTINDNPLKKDQWYIVFVLKDRSWQHLPWFTKNMQQLSEYLAFQYKISFSLIDLSKTIRGKSLIRYPDILNSKPLFRFISPPDYKVPLTNLQKTKSLLRLGNYRKKWQIEYTDEVKTFLDSASY